ncbi:hypothetical protein TrRE_jg5229 [Triparma retinervis]|uniref:SAM-dependent MTase RsmB/NOP-type domain-containing protein n=1 Tax=Triparma retinervis TaxID=2557542 RepID=A0A9W7DU87_9STRA|nr:hypothetical protein TrRE_jg5229 [Triparma retinervis]
MARNAQNLIDIATNILLTNEREHSTGLKNLLYDAKVAAGQRSMLFAMVNGAFKERDQLFAVADEEGLMEAVALPPSSLPSPLPKRDFTELQVVLYEALLGSRRVRGTSAIVDLVKGRKASLQKTLASRRKRGATNKYVPKVQMPRYVRVNYLLSNDVEAEKHLNSYGYNFVPTISTSSDNTVTVAKNCAQWDPVVPGLFSLPPGTSMHGDELVDSGALVLQDRSSCLTALALSPPPDARCIDTCSAPGNKTMHVASLMGANATGSISAFERSHQRYLTLERRIGLQGGEGFVKPVERDFMSVDVNSEFQDVTHILIDPSCSGSGLVASYGAGTKAELGEDENDIVATNGVDEEAVLELARAQTELILHAMKLPGATTIAYSTCSVHRTENEDVVLNVLNSNPNWECVPAVPKWPHRGLDIDEFKGFASKVCRADYEKDSTNGFFVARFEKKEKEKKKEEVAPEEVASKTAEGEVSTKKFTKAVKKMVKETGEMKVKKVRKRLAAEFKIDVKIAKKRLKEVVDASSKLEIDGKLLKRIT